MSLVASYIRAVKLTSGPLIQHHLAGAWPSCNSVLGPPGVGSRLLVLRSHCQYPV